MAVYRLDLSYDGSGFRGYAKQAGLRTVQGELETALHTLLKVPLATAVAGRTDAGVHALGQVVSFESELDFDLSVLRRRLDGILGPEISVTSISEAPEEFNARFSATWRRYRYLIAPGPRNPLTRGYVWTVPHELNVGEMQQAATSFVGEHDFSSFCRSIEGKSNIRNLTRLDIEEGSENLGIWVEANAFCHQMVRSIVGHLYDVGRGFVPSSDTESVIEARDRGRVATVAPAHGLTLMAVGYR